jgi:hypothetical protein
MEDSKKRRKNGKDIKKEKSWKRDCRVLTTDSIK